MRCENLWLSAANLTVLAAFLATCPRSAVGQAEIGVQEFSPFVIAVVPVVRNGAIGGISVDAEGVLRQAQVADVGRLRAAWQAALPSADDALAVASPLRKVSLRRLERAIGERVRQGRPIEPAMQFLAGLQRVQFVFVYPEQADIVLAGPAEAWTMNDGGDIVGAESGRPLLRLNDLVVAWRALADTDGATAPITCSIDPTADGLSRIQELTASGLVAGKDSLAALEEALGPQQITIEGVPATSHFARVMLAADFRMKRLAMGFEKPPISGLPGYLPLVKSASGPSPQNLLPRWWLAPKYDGLLRDEAGTSWEIRGPGVECLTEDSRLADDGGLAQTGAAGDAAQRWADNMTEQYEALSERLAVFADLRNAMDLAVVAALLVRHNLPDAAGWSFPVLTRGDNAAPEFAAPRTVDSQTSFVRKGRNWIVSVSGGVEIDPWAVIERAEVDASVAVERGQATPNSGLAWWWD